MEAWNEPRCDLFNGCSHGRRSEPLLFEFIRGPAGIGSRLRAWRYREGLTALLEALQPQMGDRILDLGAGTGYVAGRPAKYSGKVCAVEPQARRVEYIGRAFHHFGDFDAAISELRRVIKVGGALVIQHRGPCGWGARFEKTMMGERIRFLAASDLAGYLDRGGFAVRDNAIKGKGHTLTAINSR